MTVAEQTKHDGVHGTYEQALEWVGEHNRDDYEVFLERWIYGDLGEWPEYYEWLAKQEN